jgi:hypothetical protein
LKKGQGRAFFFANPSSPLDKGDRNHIGRRKDGTEGDNIHHADDKDSAGVVVNDVSDDMALHPSSYRTSIIVVVIIIENEWCQGGQEEEHHSFSS